MNTSNTVNEKVIEKVRKMLALANDTGASDGERDNALRMAYSTLTKYNLNEADVLVKELRGVEELEDRTSSPWARTIAGSIAKLFFCKYYFTRGKKMKHSFVGKTSNAITAQLMTEYVISSLRKESSKIERKENRSGTWVTSFLNGASYEIYNRCNDMIAKQTTTPEFTGTGVILASLYKTEAEANEFYINNEMKLKLKQSTSHARTFQTNGFNSGAEFGKSINLNAQVGNSRNTLRICK